MLKKLFRKSEERVENLKDLNFKKMSNDKIAEFIFNSLETANKKI